jgi:ABC-type Na+ transport system ATPase subunit NatA
LLTIRSEEGTHLQLLLEAAGHGPGRHGAVVSVRRLTKRYGELVAVDDLTFSLEAGSVTGFLGPNGAGKTTTLRLLLGLAEPTAGEALVFGLRYRELDRPARRVGAVLESNDFDPGRSGIDHLRGIALAAEIPPTRVDEVLELVELTLDAVRRVKTYSLGMRQRLGLAAALLGSPQLLVLDEPANHVDGRRPEMTQQARLDVLGPQRLLEERVGEQVDLADREIVRGAPVGVNQVELSGREWLLQFRHRDVRLLMIGLGGGSWRRQ